MVSGAQIQDGRKQDYIRPDQNAALKLTRRYNELREGEQAPQPKQGVDVQPGVLPQTQQGLPPSMPQSARAGVREAGG